MKGNLLLIGLVSSILSVQAQEPWSLKECIDYAIEHNINIKQRMIDTENKKIDVHTAKMSRLPDLNASVGESFGFGRSVGRDGTTEDNSSSSTSFGIQTSVPIFTGFRIKNQIEANKFNLATSLEELNKAKEDVSLSITGYYLQTLLYKELLLISQQQVALTKEQLEQTRLLVEAGKSPVSELYESEAQLAKDELSLTESLNNVNLALLDLSQALNLPISDNFDILLPNPDNIAFDKDKILVNPLDIYAFSVEHRPAIKAAQYTLESTKKQLKISQAAYYPSISFGAGYSNNYYYNYNLPEGQKNTSFGQQLKNNGSESLRLSMSIPIFNRFATRNQVKQSRLNIELQQLALEQAKQSLFKEIQQAFYNAVAAQEKFRSAEKAVAASRLAFQFEETKYKNGRSSALELSNARLRLEKSLSDEAQAKYDYLFRTKILDFYQGKSLY